MYTGGGSWPLPQSSGGHPNGLYPNGSLMPTNNYSQSLSQVASANGRINQGISSVGGSSFQPSSVTPQLLNGMMPPPPVKSRVMQLQDQKMKAAKQRWLDQQRREQAKKAEQEMFSDLFNAPVRESDSSGSNVAKVLGTFSEAQNVINNRTSSCIGIDYQPPTPAPSSHHTIGDDDDDRFPVPDSVHNFHDSEVRNLDSGPMNRNTQNLMNHDQYRPQKRGLPPSFQMPQSLRMSENHNPRPPSEKSYVRNSNISLANLPPPTGPSRSGPEVSFQSLQPQFPLSPMEKRVTQGYPQVQQGSSSNHMFEVPEAVMPSQSRLRQVSKTLPKLSSFDASTEKVQEMLASITHPVRSPLGGIVTPRVDLSSHMGNTGRLGIPKYTSFTAGLSLIGPLESPPRAPIKGELDSDIGSSHPLQSPRGQTNTLGSLKGPCLSEDSDSDNHKSNMEPSQPVKLAPAIESSKPKSSSGESSSNESSSYDSSSDEDEKIIQKLKPSSIRAKSIEKDLSGSDDENNVMGSDNNDYSLQSLIFKAKSTHSPHGPHSNLSQHQPSPKNSEAFPNTINILAMPGDCISDQLVKDDEDAMSNFLCQPLPELIEPISSPFSTRSSSSLKPSLSRHLLSDDDSPVTQVHKSRGNRQTVISPLGKSPTKKQHLRRTSDRISNNSDDECINNKTPQMVEAHRLTPSRTPLGRPLPRASAAPALKSPSNSDENEDESFHPGKRHQNYRAKNSRNQNRMPKKPTPKVTYSSSSSDEEADTGFSGKHAPMNNLAWKKSQKRGSKKSETSSVRGRGSKAIPLNQNFKSEPDEDDEKWSEKDVSNKKTAISMIFAGAKAGKSTGKSGIKVEIQTQGPTLTPSSQVSLNSSPPTVAIKSQGLSHAATLISHSPVHLLSEQKTKTESSLKRRPDGRPVLICCIPLAILSPGLSEILSRQKIDTSQRKRKISDTIIESSNQQSAIRQASKKSKLDSMIASPQTSSSTDSANLMPPPNQVFYSYMENRKSEEEEYADIDVAEFTNLAKRMKHEADMETASELQSIKYIRSVLFLSLAAIGNEVHGEKPAAFQVYKDSLDLLRKIPAINSSGSIGSKLSVLSNRCQSLLYLRMYKLRRQELKECQKILGDHLLKASTQSDSNSPNGQQQTISPTPSPAGSEGSMCSKSSGYTSANELTNGGLSSLATPSLTVPQNVMQKQHIFVNYLSQCHEIWDKADISAHRSHCEDFIIRLDRMFGPLTLHSSIKDLVKYTQAGIDLLLKEKEANA